MPKMITQNQFEEGLEAFSNYLLSQISALLTGLVAQQAQPRGQHQALLGLDPSPTRETPDDDRQVVAPAPS